MKNLAVAIFLIALNGSAIAEWIRVGSTDSGLVTRYADPSTIVRTGNAVIILELLDHKTVQRSEGKPFLSARVHMQYHCKEATVQLLDFKAHSQNMGKGRIVSVLGAVTPALITPDSIAASIFELVCGIR